jgi:hypothetical protein
MINITEMETTVLLAIDNSEYGNFLGDMVWTFSLEGSVPKKSLGGVLGSLSKKGLVDVNDWDDDGGAVVNMTDLGMEVYTAQINQTPTKTIS